MAVLLLFTGIAFTHAQTGALIFAEEFTSSTAGDTVAWSRINAGTATSGNTLLVANTSPLSSPVSNYNGGGGNYASSTPPTSTGSGFVKCKSTSGFSSSNYYTFYYSFLVNIAAGSGSTQQYYFGLSNGVNTNYFARVFAKKINATTYNLGMTKNSASPVTYATSSTSLTYGTTYLIVVKYAMVSGATNDTAALWINPSITSRPTMASAEVIVPTTDADVTTMTSVSFFHRTVNSGDPTNFSFDGVRLAYGLGTNQDSVAWSVLGAYAPPAITSNPSNSTICTGSNTSFVVAASGSPTSYQWQRSTTGTGGTYSNITSGSMDGGVTYSGFTTATLTLTSATTSVTGYAYRATATNVGGTSSPSSGALLTVNALPTAYTVTGGGAYCSGGAGVAVGLSNSQSGVNYQLKRGGSPVGSPVAGSTGNPISFGLQTTAGTYTVEATNTSTSCVNTMTGSVSVTIDSPPSAPAAITGTFTVCGGGASTTNLFDATAGGTWSSSNTSQATVDASGVVTGLATGTPTISYTVTSGTCSLSATQVVTVTAAPSAGTITGGTSVCVSNTLNLSDTASGGSWSSSTPSVATVNSSGQVTGVAAGTTTITYTVTSGCTAIATQLITVTNPPSAGTITGSSTVCDNSTTPLTNGVGGGVWTSSNTSIATVGSTSGTVTGVAAGSVTITYTVTTGCSAFTTFGMTVDAAPILSVISGSNSVCAGATTPLTDTATGGTWSTSDATKATVGSSSGIVTGVAAGSVTISYSKTVSSCTSVVTYGMTVNTVPATPGAISGTTTVCLGNTSPLTNGTSGGTWTSSNTSVATIGSSSGSVTSVAAGTSVISYTVSNGCGASLPATTTFTVNALPTAVISNSDTILYGGNDTVIFTGTANATCYYNIDGGSTLSATLNASGTVKIYTAPSANSTFNLTSVQSTAGCTTTLSGQSATITLDSGFMAYYEDFTNYTQNATVTTNTNWVFITGSGTNGDQITTDTGTTLTSPIAYYNGGSGKYIRYFRSSSASNNVRARRVNGPGITSNTIYYSALIRVLTTPTDSIFYFGLTPSVPNTNYFAKVFIKTSGTNLFKLGISKSAANGTFGTTSLSTNVTYLVLVKYTVVPGSSNDSVSLWVNPVISTEPTSATAEATDFSGSDFSIA
ncbi:MAG: hypothetical protein EBX41_02100, partial [Chitinophagia bacterium]|nr:hypothetical protein [Chitinophagia bacterium]